MYRDVAQQLWLDNASDWLAGALALRLRRIMAVAAAVLLLPLLVSTALARSVNVNSGSVADLRCAPVDAVTFNSAVQGCCVQAASEGERIVLALAGGELWAYAADNSRRCMFSSTSFAFIGAPVCDDHGLIYVRDAQGFVNIFTPQGALLHREYDPAARPTQLWPTSNGRIASALNQLLGSQELPTPAPGQTAGWQIWSAQPVIDLENLVLESNAVGIGSSVACVAQGRLIFARGHRAFRMLESIDLDTADLELGVQLADYGIALYRFCGNMADSLYGQELSDPLCWLTPDANGGVCLASWDGMLLCATPAGVTAVHPLGVSIYLPVLAPDQRYCYMLGKDRRLYCYDMAEHDVCSMSLGQIQCLPFGDDAGRAYVVNKAGELFRVAAGGSEVRRGRLGLELQANSTPLLQGRTLCIPSGERLLRFEITGG